MLGIALGAASFLVVFWVDLLALKGIRSLKPVVWLAGIALFVAGILLCLQDAGRIPIPAPLSGLGWALCVLFGLLLVYSLFIEIPFLSAYLRPGSPATVISRGTYALCRHPGVLWLAGFLAGLVLARGSRCLLLALPVWLGLDVLYVVLQEKLFFVRLFGRAYEDYQRKVPLLIPTARSFRACLSTMFAGGKKQ